MSPAKVAALLAALAVSACHLPWGGTETRLPLPGETDRTLPPGVATKPAEGTDGPQLTRKVVDTKQEPVTLIAVDRSICRVSEKRFRDTQVGERVFCGWTKQ